MSILVTGGAGYIGSHTVVELLNRDELVVIVDNFTNSQEVVIDRIKKITGKQPSFKKADVRDVKDMDAVFAQYNFESVIHFAGSKAVGESVKKPLLYYRNNLESTWVLIELMKKYKVPSMIFSSSAVVYGDADQVPIKEDTVYHCTNPYGRTKMINELFLQDVVASCPGFTAICLRFFNPIGAHESGLLGEDPRGIPNNLMPYITQVAVGRLDELSVFGDDYPTRDGTGVRDYIHVVDLAKGHLTALDYFRQNPASGFLAVNLGTGRGYSVLELIHTFSKVSGIDIPYRITERRSGDIATSYADPGKAKELFGWEAEFDLQRMCEDSWRWQRNNPTGYGEG